MSEINTPEEKNTPGSNPEEKILAGCPLPEGYYTEDGDEELPDTHEAENYAAEFNCMAIDRLRITTDGDGVTTLVCAWGCPLNCAYCINPQCKRTETKTVKHTPESLLEAVKKDNIYFSATGGGITFGGGEPLMFADFIAGFKKVIPSEWKIYAETCLNVPTECVKTALTCVDGFIIDIKDMNPRIYHAYTENYNYRVKHNLRLICDAGRADDCVIRIPLIADFNTDSDRQASRAELEKIGFTRFDMFVYNVERAEKKKKHLNKV